MMENTLYFNPYDGKTFFEFFIQLIFRLFYFFTGKLSFSNLASDEIQIIVLVGVAASSSLVGTFLVLRKMTMLANSLSHTILLGIVSIYVLMHYGFLNNTSSHDSININAMLLAALFTGLITAFLTEFLTKFARLQEDASTGLIFSSLFALGIVLVTLLTRNAHIGTEVVMGNVDALHINDCKLVLIIFAINAFIFTVFFKEFKITTFDPSLSRAFGFSTIFFNYLLMTQVSATVVGAFRAVGVLMVLAFITAPALTARLLTNSLKCMLFLGIVIGSGASLIGVALSRHILTTHGLALSTGGIVVCILAVFFSCAVLFKLRKNPARES